MCVHVHAAAPRRRGGLSPIHTPPQMIRAIETGTVLKSELERAEEERT